jgi:hypothetical protein
MFFLETPVFRGAPEYQSKQRGNTLQLRHGDSTTRRISMSIEGCGRVE